MTPSARLRFVAVGLGARTGIDPRAVLSLVTDSLAAHHASPIGFYTHPAKVNDQSLIAAALHYGHALDGVAAELLLLRDPETLTRSLVSRDRFGLSSVSECAALAGGGRGSRLIGPRLARNGVTVALAEVLR